MPNYASFRIGDRVVHPALGCIEGPHGTVRLEPRVMDLLVYLANSGGRVISRDDIIRDVWRGTLVTDDVITRSISQIRRALADDWRKTPVIETIPKRGYRLIPTVQFLPPGLTTESPIAPPPLIAPQPIVTLPPVIAAPDVDHQPSRAPRRFAWPVAATVSLLLIAIAAEIIYHRRDSSDRPVAGAPPGAISSVMVAPFVQADGAAASNFLGAQLSAELIDSLGASAELRVIGANSSAALIKSGKSPLQAASELNAAALITGTVRETDTQLLVAISMLDPKSGQVLHGHDYQFPKNGAIAASEAVAQDVARMLGVQPSMPLVASESPTRSPEAYQLFLEARYYLGKNETGAVQEGIGFLRQAIKQDPSFAEAHAALAIALMLQADFGNRPVDEVAPEAQQEIDKAFALQPRLAQAHAGQGLIYMYTRRLDEAAESLRQATAIHPNYSQAHMWLGLVAQSQWQIRRSIASYEHALDIEPLSSIATLNLGRALDLGGLYERSERELRRGLTSHPQFANLHWALGHVLWNRGQLAHARAEYSAAIEGGLNVSALYGQMAILLIDMGATEKSKEWILRGERVERNDETVWLARLMEVVAEHRSDELRLRFSDPKRRTQIYSQATLATLDFYNRDYDSARRRFAESLLIEHSDEDLMHSRWLALEGHAPALDAAAANVLGGNATEGKEMLRQFADFIAGLRTNGLDSPGLDYEESAIAALSGDSALAAARLKAARNRGWREDWFLALDPKMASVSAL